MTNTNNAQPLQVKGVKIRSLDLDLINALQYSFKIVPNPFEEIGKEIGKSEEYVLRETKKLVDEGIVKRIGFSVNFRSQRMVGALVGVKVNDVNKIKELLMGKDNVTHNYVRVGSPYNVWFTIKSKTINDMMREIREIVKAVNAEDYVVLPSKRACKVSVRYDVKRGVAWSKPRLEPKEVPSPEELGFPKEGLKYLRRLEIVSRPFKRVAEKLGMNEDELLEKVELMVKKGVLRDPGAAVDGEKLGFKHNAMVVLKGDERTCEWIALNVPEASHVVLREVPEKWPYPVYFVVHAVDRERAEEVIGRVVERVKPEDYKALFSVENLKPGVAR